MTSHVAPISRTTSIRPFKPWNLGKLIGQKPPLKLREVWAIRIRLQIQERPRDLAMFNLAIDNKLRGCDLVALRVDDVLPSGRVRPRTTVIQKKTGWPFSSRSRSRHARRSCTGSPGAVADPATACSRAGSGRTSP